MKKISRTTFLATEGANAVSRPITQGDLNPVGMVVYSPLTEPQFQALNGTEWVLADGRTSSGSSLESITGLTTVPDLRGIFVRGAGAQTISSVSYSATLNAKTGDSLQNITGALSVAGGAFDPSPAGAFTGTPISTVRTSPGTAGTFITGMSFDASRVARTGTETKPANIALNPFMKIN